MAPVPLALTALGASVHPFPRLSLVRTRPAQHVRRRLLGNHWASSGPSAERLAWLGRSLRGLAPNQSLWCGPHAGERHGTFLAARERELRAWLLDLPRAPKVQSPVGFGEMGEMPRRRQLDLRSRTHPSMKRSKALQGAPDSLANQAAKKPAAQFGKETPQCPGFLIFVAEAGPVSGGAQRGS